MLNFDKIPDTLYTKPVAGEYVLVVKESKIVKAKESQSLMLQNNYASEDGSVKVNYDNSPFMDKDNNPINYGLVKIKKLTTAMGLNLTGNIDPKIIPALIMGKKFKVKLDVTANEKYLEIKDINSIAPAEDTVMPDVKPSDFLKEVEKDVTVDVEDPWSL